MTTKEKLAELNRLRIVNNMKPMKAWKQSVAKLDAAINELNVKASTEAVEETVEEVVEELPEATTQDVFGEVRADEEPAEDTNDDMEEVTDEKYISLDRFGTIRAASEFMLLEKDTNGEGLPYKFILRCVQTCFPKAKTSIACLRWYANKMNQNGTIMPPRKSGNCKK